MPFDPTLILLLVLLFGGMWWMSNRTRKQQQAAAAFRDNLQPGQEVMTGSGMYGTVVSVDGDVITLETSPGQHTRWFKPAIAKLVETSPELVEDADADEDLDEYDEDYDDAEGEYEDDEYDDDEDYEDEDGDEHVDTDEQDAPAAETEPDAGTQDTRRD